MAANTIHIVETHDQVLRHWRAIGASGLRVLHLDFHCDLRGTLINRQTQRAYRIWDRFPALDEGNFLTHAIFEGVVDRLRWVHDDPGGRSCDMKTVKYESDISSLPHRCLINLRRDRGKPIKYRVMHTDNWSGIEPDEVLDINWDYFASVEYPVESVASRVAAFMSKDLDDIPRQTYACYSPAYSHSTREAFHDFVDELARRFNAEVVKATQPGASTAKTHVTQNMKSLAAYRWARDTYHRVGLAMRRRGIY